MLDARRKKNPSAISESQSIITGYFRDINKLVRKMARLVKERIEPILDQYSVQLAQTADGQRGLRVRDDDLGLALNAAFAGIEDEFSALRQYAAHVASSRMMQANFANRRLFLESWKKTVGIDVSPLLSPSIMVKGRLIDKDSAVPVLDAIRANVDLIQTVPKQHLAKIQKVISEGIQNGDDVHSLKQAIAKVNGQDTRRAKLIARDQLQKLNGVLVQARQQSLGIGGYIWRTSHDERVRDSHRDNDGKKFQWDSPPRETGHPGEDINCRCVAEPDLGQLVPSLASPEIVGPKQVNRISINPVVEPKAKKSKKKKVPVKKTKAKPLTQSDLDKSRAETERARKVLAVQKAKTEKAKKQLAEQDKRAKEAAKKLSKQKATIEEMEAKIKKLNAETKQIDRKLAKEDRKADKT